MQTNSRLKFCRPPVCPKPEKATTITIDSNQHSPFAHLKKNQRLTYHHSPKQSISRVASDAIEPSSSSSSLNCFQNKREKANVLRNDYQQYTRKNYLKSNKKDSNDPIVQSRMTEKVIADCSEKEELSRNLKSKSAVNYVKYFIKSVSNLPTQPSSQDQNALKASRDAPEPILKLPGQQQNQSKCSHQRGRKTHRAKISERLKSLKSNRTKSNKKQLHERDLVPSIEKRSRKEVSRQKINGNIKNLHSSQSLVAKMKARSRNRRIVLKIKQLNLTKLQDSFSLMICSKIDKTHTSQIEIAEKIELHLQLLNLLPEYVKQFKQIYEEIECWDELLFLTYKKFYLERLKIHQALSGNSVTYSPFRFPFAAVSGSELKEFRNSLDGIKLQQQVGKQNQLIRRALQELYNHIIEKSGKYINLLEEDDFSEQIYWLMGEEVRLLEEGQKDQLRDVRKKRIGLIIKCCFMIAFLNGESLDIELLLTGEQQNQAGVKQFENFLNRLVE